MTGQSLIYFYLHNLSKCFSVQFASDSDAYKALDGLALHWYSDFFIPVSIIDTMHESYPDKTIIYTESSINGEFGEWSFNVQSKV